MSLSGKIAVDANVILSAVIGGKAGRIFREATALEFVTVPAILDEVKKYLPVLAKKKGLSLGLMRSVLDLLPLTIASEETYADFLDQARVQVGNRDPDDVPLLALALSLACPVWSNDDDLKGLAEVKVYTTAELLAKRNTLIG
ncbi:PIN domain-containing protein [Candidatus Desulforudis audaxviator]|uniref:PilT protein domain protein n=1 Tax=Desulforudis audaxviator (strain MP104C) TaxID=477974 RepID=B1I0W5_DESAP|nr:PIN domain-containing protein [Candidatus Desulforudis audaxviator]ACA58879.1 PilT protein domain protein [Candidatus Desulforudis audaxviator MP104C]